MNGVIQPLKERPIQPNPTVSQTIASTVLTNPYAKRDRNGDANATAAVGFANCLNDQSIGENYPQEQDRKEGDCTNANAQ